MQRTQALPATIRDPAHGTTTLRRRGFTLIEIIVVTVILVIVGAMVIPRMTGRSVVTAQLAAEQTASALAMFAYRSSLSAQPVALRRDPEFGTIEVWLLDVDPEQPDQPPRWRLDRFSKPLTLPAGIVLSQVRINEQPLETQEWQVVATPSMPRPRIELVVASEEGDDEIAVILEPRASAPYLAQAGRTTEIVRVPIDLDSQGRAKELW